MRLETNISRSLVRFELINSCFSIDWRYRYYDTLFSFAAAIYASAFARARMMNDDICELISNYDELNEGGGEEKIIPRWTNN